MMPAAEPPTESQRRALSPREYQVLRMKAQGLSEKDVAKALGLSRQTVKNYAGAAYDALGLSGERSMVRAFAALGWLRAPE